LRKKRAEYERELQDNNPRDYDLWFDLIRLAAAAAASPKDFDAVRKTYERSREHNPTEP
jgi:hypothetical protein